MYSPSDYTEECLSDGQDVVSLRDDHTGINYLHVKVCECIGVIYVLCMSIVSCFVNRVFCVQRVPCDMCQLAD